MYMFRKNKIVITYKYRLFFSTVFAESSECIYFSCLGNQSMTWVELYSIASNFE